MSLKETLFWIATGSVVSFSAVMIAAVWKLVESDIAWRGATTVAIIGAAAVTLSLLQTYLR